MEKEKYQSLREFLPGWQEDMPEAYGRLAEIFAQQVRETMERRAAGLKPPAWAAAAFESGLRQSTEEEKSDSRAA